MKTESSWAELLRTFARFRGSCPALREVLIPDDLWPQFESWHAAPEPIAQNRSILLLAMERGNLARMTCPVDRYLIREGKPRPELTRQYRQDLQERWMLEAEPLRRHKQSRTFMGRIAELHVAEWLETQGWCITSLEALGGDSDIEATTPDGPTAACEIKCIGVEDTYFCAVCESLAGRPSGLWVSDHDAVNYLLFRFYEAARKLEDVVHRRIAVVAIDHMTWGRFALQVHEGWIDWAAPDFYDTRNGASGDWDAFLKKQLRRYPRLPQDLPRALCTLDEVWLFEVTEDFRYNRRLAVPNQRLQRTQ